MGATPLSILIKFYIKFKINKIILPINNPNAIVKNVLKIRLVMDFIFQIFILEKITIGETMKNIVIISTKTLEIMGFTPLRNM